MRLGTKIPLQQYTMKSGVERVSLEQVTSEKDLGVTVDNKLLFKEHITEKSAIANRNLGVIFKSFTYLDKEMFLCLYKSLVRPHVEYATTVWSPMYKKRCSGTRKYTKARYQDGKLLKTPTIQRKAEKKTGYSILRVQEA